MSSQHTPDRFEAKGRAPEDEPLSIRQLEVFVALVDHRSFTRAAASLGVSQPTVSGHMTDLENRLGVRLVERMRSGVQPTQEGALLVRPARDALRGEANLRLAAAELRGLVVGRLVVGGSSIPAAYLLPTYLAQFRRKHPSVTVQIHTGPSQLVIDEVIAGVTEIAIVGSRPKGRNTLHVEPSVQDELVLICAGDHPFAERSNIDADEIKKEPLILRPVGSATRDTMLAGLGLKSSDLESIQALEIGGNDAVKSAVRSNLGLSFVSRLSIEDELRAGSLATVKVNGFDGTRSLFVVSRNPGTLSPAGAAFYEIVV